MFNYCTKAKIAFRKLDITNRALRAIIIVTTDSALGMNKSGTGPACCMVVVGHYHNTADKTAAIM